MSTRSVIIITGKTYDCCNKPLTVRLYKHSDGYPSETLGVIADALEQTKKVAKEHTDRFRRHVDGGKLVYPVKLAIGKVIGASASFYGIGVEIEKEFKASFKPSHFGDQCDLEWLYVIDLEKRDVSVFNAKGVVSDPFSEVKSYSALACKTAYKEIISKAISRIIDLGFSFNAAKKAKKKTATSDKTKKLNALKRKKDEKSKSPKSSPKSPKTRK